MYFFLAGIWFKVVTLTRIFMEAGFRRTEYERGQHSEKALNIWKLTLAETTRPLIKEREESLPCPFFLLSLLFLCLLPVDACSRAGYKPKRRVSFPWKPLLLPQRTRSFIRLRCLPHHALVVQKVDNGILWIIIREGKVRPCREKNETKWRWFELTVLWS